MATSNGFFGPLPSDAEGGGNKEAGKPRAGSVAVCLSGAWRLLEMRRWRRLADGGQMQIQHTSDDLRHQHELNFI